MLNYTVKCTEMYYVSFNWSISVSNTEMRQQNGNKSHYIYLRKAIQHPYDRYR